MEDPSTPSISKPALQVLFTLRFFQLGAIALTLFIYSYLTWHHTHHYCAFYAFECTPSQLDYVAVPWEYIYVITAVSPIPHASHLSFQKPPEFGLTTIGYSGSRRMVLYRYRLFIPPF